MRIGEEHDAERLAAFVHYRSTLYDAAVAQMDEAVGRLLDRLSALGLLDRTLVAFTSDHGEEFLEHGLIGHSKQLFSESMLVPLILAGPGVSAGMRVESTVENRLLAGTLLELVGVEHAGFSERLPLTVDPSSTSKPPLFHTTRRGRWPLDDASAVVEVGDLHGIRSGGKLVVWAPSAEAEGRELVAAFSDPAEEPIELRDEERAPLLKAIADWLEAGALRRPRVLGGGEGAEDLLRALGYLGEADSGEGH
jgi:arylsulfatase A-like enzyme